MNDIPTGWASATLGQMASFEMGQAPPGSASNFTGEGTVFVKAGEFGRTFPDVREWTTKPLKFATRGDVLICVVGATAGKLNMGIDCAIGRSVAAIRPFEGVDQTSLYRQLTLHVERLRKDSTGSAQGVISKGMLEQLQLALPPQNEQRRIADKLDTVLARVDAVNDRLARVAPLLKRFRQSVLAAAMSGKLTEDWRRSAQAAEPLETTLGALIKVSSGDGLTAKEMRLGDVPVFGGNGINGYHDEGNTSSPQIVIGRVGYYCGSVHLTPTKAWVTDNALLVRFDPNVVSQRFLYYGLLGTNLRENTSSTAQPVISGQKIYPLSFRLPSPAEQAEVVRSIELLFGYADRLEARLRAAQTAAERLTPALLAKAFRGELVPQDPNDEPASEMLKRLAAMQNTTTAPARGRRRRGRRGSGESG